MMTKEEAVILAELLLPWGAVRHRAMFGGYGVYVNEKFAAIIGDGKLFIKVKGIPEDQLQGWFDNRNQPYEEAKNYCEAHPSQFDDPEWVESLGDALRKAGVF